MPNFLTAKTLADRTLRKIGALPPTQLQADAAQLRVAMQWLEMTLNSSAGTRPFVGLWRVVDIPIEAGIGDYDLSDYADADEAMHIFSVSIVEPNQDPQPLDMQFESQGALENLSLTGSPQRCVATRDAIPTIRIYPTPTIQNENVGAVLRVRMQTYAEAVDPNGIADSDTRLRPTWYLWAIYANAYECGSGPIRWLNPQELNRIEKDRDKIFEGLLARDGQNNTGSSPVTEPYDY